MNRAHGAGVVAYMLVGVALLRQFGWPAAGFSPEFWMGFAAFTMASAAWYRAGGK